MPDPRILSMTDLLALLPSGDSSKFPLSSARNDVRFEREGLPAFVAPTLRERADVPSVAGPSVVIVSAAGAVGKSTLASEVARQKQAPLWDLARAKSVGQGSLDGMLSMAFGPGGGSVNVYKALHDGELVLVVDALDEARVKVTEGAFEDFLDDIARLASQGPPGAKVVLFGRTQIADTAWLVLQDRGTKTAILTIEPFDEDQSKRYIERRVRAHSPEAAAAMDAHPRPFSEARELLLKHIREGVVSNRPGESAEVEARSFVGYAPVLDAVGVLLATGTNFGALRTKLDAPLSGGQQDHLRPIALLRRVVESILEREQEQKLVKDLRPSLEALAAGQQWTDWGSLYTPAEQCERIIGLVLKVPSISPGPANLPPALAALYEKQLASFLSEHPFLRDGSSFVNVVFESYLFARALTQNMASCRSAIEARLNDRQHLPSRLLGDFYLLMKSGDGAPTVPPEHVGWLYDSLLSAETDEVRVEFTLEGDDPRESDFAEGRASAAEGEFTFVRASNADEPTRIDFRVLLDSRSVIRFSRYIKEASIIVPCTVRLGASQDEYEIGPRVSIACSHLVIAAQRLAIGGRPRQQNGVENAVFLEARRCDTEVVQKPRVHCALTVSWPGSRTFPWTEYSQEQEPFADDAALAAAYRRFRRIVMTLRSHSRGTLARYKGKIEHQRVLQGGLGQALLARLVGDRILKLDGKFYYWVPEVAATSVGISWHQLNARATSPLLTEYLTRFIRAHSDA